MEKQRATYRVQNWSEYNKSLINRGNISLWFSDDLNDSVSKIEQTGKQGRPKQYSDALIEMCLSIKYLYKLTYRATQGFAISILKALKLDVSIPSYTQMSRRAKTLHLQLYRVSKSSGSIDIAIDSTGLKVFGEGEWKVRKHGADSRRTWRKLHLGVDPLSHEIVASVMTDNSHSDSQVFDELLDQIDDTIDRCFADGAYDTGNCYEACFERKTVLVTPPRINATKDLPCPEHLLPRNEAIDRISVLDNTCDDAREQWKLEADYHCRSISETAMFRFKKLFGGDLISRHQESQKIEVQMKINLMNKMTALGMPQTMVNYA